MTSGLGPLLAQHLAPCVLVAEHECERLRARAWRVVLRGSLRTPALGHADRERQDAGDETERLGQVEAHQLELASAG